MPRAEQRLTTRQLADLLEVGESTLRRWRALETGPRFVREQRRVFYRLRDVNRWRSKRERERERDANHRS